MTAFEELGLMPELAAAVEQMDWQLPTDIQSEAIPLILGGGDVLMAAETGSGKTGAFCLPIVQTVWEVLSKSHGVNRKKSATAASTEDSSGFSTTAADGGGARGDGGAGSAAAWRLSAVDRDRFLAVSDNGLCCQSRDQSAWNGARATCGVRAAGRWYYEATVVDEGLGRVGWSSSQAVRNLGLDAKGFGFGGTGKKSHNSRFDTYGRPFSRGDVVGCWLDLDAGEIAYSLNGQSLGRAFAVPADLARCGLFPAVVLKNAEMSFNFGGSSAPFRYTPVGTKYRAVAEASGSCLVQGVTSSSSAAAAHSKTADTPRPCNAPLAIVVAPTRELAQQTADQLLLTGEQSAQLQQRLEAAATATVDIVVATPGRLVEFFNKKKMLADWCRFLVFDEVDSLAEQRGGAGLVQKIHAIAPQAGSAGHRLQVVMCSATLHSPVIRSLADRLVPHATWVDLKGLDSVPDTVHHVACCVDPRKDTSWRTLTAHVQTDTVHALDGVGVGVASQSPEALSEAVKLLKAEYCVRAILAHRMEQALIFCRTKLDCDNMERYFKQLNPTLNRQQGGGSASEARLNDPLTCVCLHSDRSDAERQMNLKLFRDKQVRLLICTDVAARGIDIPRLSYVISVTMSDLKANYVHRVGRVGRAERMGLSISLVAAVSEKVWYHQCASRGRGCSDTRLTHQRGCCIWYDEQQLLADVEQHLGVTVDQIGPDMHVPVSEFDGRVVYGQKRAKDAAASQRDRSHIDRLAPSVRRLALLQRNVQTIFLRSYGGTAQLLPVTL